MVRTECSRSQSPDKWESGGTATLANKIWVMGHGLQKDGSANLKFMDVGEFRQFVHMSAEIFTEDSKVRVSSGGQLD